MEVLPNPQLGVSLQGFDVTCQQHVETLKKLVYDQKVVVLKDQNLSPTEFADFGSRCGIVEPYYEPSYHHPQVPEVFVSATVPVEGIDMGVPRTGSFWHSDYQFFDRPLDLTLIYPQIIPSTSRGTYFINLADAFQRLPEPMKETSRQALATHTVRRYFKIRSTDVHRPVGELIDEVDKRTPPVTVPLVQYHPTTGEEVLYLSAGFTERLTIDGVDQPALLEELLFASGQLDETYTHPLVHLQNFTLGDLVVWDNRSLVHRGLHSAEPEPAVSFRVSVYERQVKG